MTSQRAYRLRPWLVRALIPPRRIGSYVLYQGRQATYVGRSDSDVRRRLLEHAAVPKADYFTYDVHVSTEHAFHAECSLFHAVGTGLANRNHPDTPDYLAVQCEFCGSRFQDVRASRFVLPSLVYQNHAESETFPPQPTRKGSYQL